MLNNYFLQFYNSTQIKFLPFHLKKSYLYSFGKRISSTSFGGFFHFLSVICSTSYFDKQLICSTSPQSNHVIIFTLIKIIFMLKRLSWSFEAQAMKFHNLKLTLQLVILSAKSTQMLLYNYICSIEALREWSTSSLDAPLRAPTADVGYVPNAKYLAHIPR